MIDWVKYSNSTEGKFAEMRKDNGYPNPLDVKIWSDGNERSGIEYIDKVKSENSEKPFFLYLALPSPHTPILPTKQWVNKSELNPYADFVLQIDSLIGRINSLLIEENIEENTILIISSDNGCIRPAN